jgi:hypothetical protein
MKLPFTIEQFLKVFEDYNLAVWPMQVILYILAIAAVYFAVKKFPQSDKFILLVLAFLWIWMGAVYHLLYFTSINKPAYIFGIVFIVEGMLFIKATFSKNKISIHIENNINGITGSLLILFALVLYPLIGYFLGHRYQASPTFGLPCPTTIFTFGILLFADKRVPLTLLIIPFIWSLVGFSAAFSLGIIEDTGLVISGLISITLIVIHNNRRRNDLLLSSHSS